MLLSICELQSSQDNNMMHFLAFYQEWAAVPSKCLPIILNIFGSRAAVESWPNNGCRTSASIPETCTKHLGLFETCWNLPGKVDYDI